ncbi:MAG: hypothetical protein JXA10_01695 [Anaerolineae bacterium]|nr:hypothetical protein [Anaerolineae bacterium]
MVTDPQLDSAAWRANLTFLVDAIYRIHPHPFYLTPEAHFKQMVNQTTISITALSHNQVVMAFARLVALLRDGHSYFAPFTLASSFYPLRCYCFSDGIYAVAAAEPYRDVIGGRLIQIGETGLTRVAAHLLPGIAHDNEMTQRWLLPFVLTHAEMLEAGGFIPDRAGAAAFTFEMPGPARQAPVQRRLLFEPVSLADHVMPPTGATIGLPSGPDLMYLRRSTEAFWFMHLSFSDTLYIQYNRVWETTQTGATLAEFADSLRAVVERHTPNRIMIDLRHNNGGDHTTYAPLLDLLTTHPTIKHSDRFFALIGRKTFGAAVNFAAELETHADVIFVGEPTGGRPHCFGDPEPVTLPHGGYTAHISRFYWQNGTPDDRRPWIEPHIPIALSSTDYFSNRDPVLAAALVM